MYLWLPEARKVLWMCGSSQRSWWGRSWVFLFRWSRGDLRQKYSGIVPGQRYCAGTIISRGKWNDCSESKRKDRCQSRNFKILTKTAACIHNCAQNFKYLPCNIYIFMNIIISGYAIMAWHPQVASWNGPFQRARGVCRLRRHRQTRESEVKIWK